jgi:DNA-binding transcriptional LysR family regulator
MELRNIQYFIAIAEEQSFSKAALSWHKSAAVEYAN